MNISFADIAVVMTAAGGLIGILVTWMNSAVAANARVYEGRVTDLQAALGELKEEMKRDAEAAERERGRDRELFEAQMTALRASLAAQEQTIRRQEHMLSDYVRHVSKLENAMARAQLEIPPFEPSYRAENFS